jgi:predicted CXXCH cytochrome family protein
VYNFSKYTASTTYNWGEEVTYPQGTPTVTTGVGTTALGIVRCITCHNSGSTAYNTGWNRVSADLCIGCHGDKVGAVDHMIQMGGK